jgi:hypothetical protein
MQFRRVRSTQTPTSLELNWKAIPELARGGWRLCGTDEIALVGTVEKNYLVFGPDKDPTSDANVGFIAKKQKRSGNIECATEEIISRIGHLLPICIADSRLVRLPDTDPPDIRFMSKNFVRRRCEQLVHGAEIVAAYLGASSMEEMNQVFDLTDKINERRFYNVGFIFQVLAAFGRSPEERRQFLDGMGRLLAFDALIGAPDRHALNWGIIQGLSAEPETSRRFAPIFDTARGLFGEHRESHLVAIDSRGKRRQKIAAYAERSTPVFGCAAGHHVNHFDLIRNCLSEGPPEVVRAIREVVRAFGQIRTERMIRRKFTRIITQRRIGWIVDLLQARSARLKLIVG